MNLDTYERLCDALGMRGGPAPALKCKEFYDLLEELFTPQEAEVTVKLPLEPVSAEKAASEILKCDLKDAEHFLERMANKGLLFSHEIRGVTQYTVMPLIPGIFEMQFTKGEVNERTKRLARLFDDYFDVLRQSSESSASKRSVFPFARIIAVEQEIPSGVKIHTYDKLSEYIARCDDIAVCICYCRHHGELVGRPCNKPKDVCMCFGPQARYVVKRGFGRPVSREEALQVLGRAEKEGLIHCSSNTSKYISFVCNCCDCHCGIIQSIKSANSPSMAANSGFLAVVAEDACSGCGACLDRCQMEALTMTGSVVISNAERCIGCGLCVSECPAGALGLKPRDGASVPPTNQRELTAAIISSIMQDC